MTIGEYRTLAHKILWCVDAGLLPELKTAYTALPEKAQRELRTASQTPDDIRELLRPSAGRPR